MSKYFYDCNDGYYRKNNVYRDRPLAYCPYGSCGVIETKDALYLKSYTTFVIKYDKKTNFLQCSGTYSRTNDIKNNELKSFKAYYNYDRMTAKRKQEFDKLIQDNTYIETLNAVETVLQTNCY